MMSSIHPYHFRTMEITVTAKASASHITGRISAETIEHAAFYVFKDGEKVHQRWYSKDLTVEFPHQGAKGTYKIQGFVRNAGVVKSKFSSEVFVFGEHVEADDLAKQIIAPGPHLIKADGQEFHCLYAPHPEQRLFVMLTAAVNRERLPLPIFNRWGWKNRLPGHVLCISDPTLAADDSLGIGWYLGGPDGDVTEKLSQLVKKFAAALGIRNNRIVTYGSSAGGFAAMMLASKLNGSTAVAINPQTHVLRYHPKHVDEMLSACFPGVDKAQAVIDYDARLNASAHLPGKTMRLVIAQNRLDRHHWEDHYPNLAKSLGLPNSTGASTDEQHWAIVYDDASGHGPETPEVFSQIIERVKINIPQFEQPPHQNNMNTPVTANQPGAEYSAEDYHAEQARWMNSDEAKASPEELASAQRSEASGQAS